MKFTSIRFKSRVLYTSILCVILVIFSTVLFSFVRHILYRDLDERLRIKAKEIAGILKVYTEFKKIENHPVLRMEKFFDEFNDEAQERMVIDDLWRSQVQMLDLKNDYVNILNPQGQTIIISGNFTPPAAALFRQKVPFSLKGEIIESIVDENYKLRAINLPVSYTDLRPFVVQVGTPLEPVLDKLDQLLFFLIIVILLTLGVTSFLGSFFARRILDPVMEVARTAENISHKDFHKRVSETQVDEEMKYLIHSFNNMIERLEKSFLHISEFSSHVAHELKTPLAIIRGEMELALTETREAGEYQRVIQVGLEEIDRLIKIIRDLLLLAKLDYKPDIFNFEKVDLTVFLKNLHEHSKILADAKNINVELNIPAGEICIDADPVHLRRLFFNLINNAVKFTGAGGVIGISLSVVGETVRAEVSDTGVGIEAEHLGKIFDKFFRAHKDDASFEPGNGLGLSIAQSIVKAHRGNIAVESIPGKGSRFIMTFPLV